MLAETRLLPAQQTILRNYVASGGSLVAMRPDPALADLFGLTYLGPRPEALLQFLAFDTTSGRRRRPHRRVDPVPRAGRRVHD